MGFLQLGFDHPWALLLAPPALLLLYLLERWRRRPVVVQVADLGLFVPSAEAEAEARARRRQLGLRWLLRALAALLLVATAAGAALRWGAPGPLVVELVLDAGVSSGAAEGAGTRLDRHRQHLLAVIDRLRADDRVRVHALPAGAFPPAKALSLSQGRAALESARPTAASADVRAAAERLSRVGGGRVFVATDQPLELPGVAVATCGSALVNHGIVSLHEEAGELFVSVAATGAVGPEPVEVVLNARGPGVHHEGRLSVAAPPGGRSLARWPLPAGVEEVSARLSAPDGLPTDDVGFAVRAPLAAQRVAVVGDPGEDVERALGAVPGVRLERVAPTDRLRDLAGRCDVLILPRAPEGLLPVATVVVPGRLVEATSLPGGRLSGEGAPDGLLHAFAALAIDPVVLPRVGPVPAGLGSLRVRVTAGERPLLLTGGAGRRLVAVFTAPVSGTAWTGQQSFPLLWAELLGLAASGEGERPVLRAVAAGRAPGDLDLERAPWHVGRYRDRDGRPALGTVAASLPPAPPQGLRAFSAASLDALDALRSPAPSRSLAWLLALLALVCALAGWWPQATRIPSKLERQPLPHP